MNRFDTEAAERERRMIIAEHTRCMIKSKLKVTSEDDTSLRADYGDYYLQISFSKLHPLMVICLAKALKTPAAATQQAVINRLNLNSILGSHAINDDVGCYAYRATQWLDTELDEGRFFEILDRCVEEANRGYLKLAG